MSNARNIASGAKFVDTAGDTTTGGLTISSTAGQLKLTDTDGTEQNTTIKQSGGNVFIQARDNTNNAGIVFAGNGGGTYDEFMRITNEGHVQTYFDKRFFSNLRSWYPTISSYSASENSSMSEGNGVNQPADGKMIPVAYINTRAYQNSICIKTNLAGDGYMFQARLTGYMYGYAHMDAWIGGYTYNGGVINVTAYENASGGQYFASAYRSTDLSLCFKVQLGQTGYTEGNAVFQFGGHGDGWRGIKVTAVQVRNDGSNHAF